MSDYRNQPSAKRAPSRAHRRWWTSAIVAWLGLAVVATLSAAETLDDRALVERLRDGGLVVYFRHERTDWSLADQVRDADDIPSCDPQRMRQLSDAGRERARATGAAMRALDVPVARVLASPYCRTRETAAALGLGPVATTDAVMNLRVAERYGGRDAIVARARALIATPPPGGSNIVIVAHGNVAREATPAYPGEGEAVVFAPDGRGDFTLLARIPHARWPRLVDAR